MTTLVYRTPSALLNELGVTEPKDIEIEAIAFYCGATVVYEPVHGCAARILGYGDRAIITVDPRAHRPRQRFSIGHELGHWMRDRGQIAMACTERTMLVGWDEQNPERQANHYAVELLLPEDMFTRLARNKPIDFATVDELGAIFQMSLTATAIRLVELGSFPAMIVCTEGKRRRWFVRGPAVPDELSPTDEPGRDTVAYELTTGGNCIGGPQDVGASGWINHPRSSRYAVQEDSIKISDNLLLSLIWWKDERQILDLD